MTFNGWEFDCLFKVFGCHLSVSLIPNCKWLHLILWYIRTTNIPTYPTLHYLLVYNQVADAWHLSSEWNDNFIGFSSNFDWLHSVVDGGHCFWAQWMRLVRQSKLHFKDYSWFDNMPNLPPPQCISIHNFCVFVFMY